MTSTYRDPTFEKVAAREAAAQRQTARECLQLKQAQARRESPAYTAQRRRKIARLTKWVLSGKLKG